MTKMDKVKDDELSVSIGVREEINVIKLIERICCGLDMWGDCVGADD